MPVKHPTSRARDDADRTAERALVSSGLTAYQRAYVSGPTCTEATEATPKVITNAALVPEHLLDGGEIVIFAIKPSLWFIVFASSRWLIGMVLVTLLAGWLRGGIERLLPVNAMFFVNVALLLGAARVVFAMLQWASCLYVLTNRRIMRLSGVMNVDVFECSLMKIQNTFLTLAWYERLTRLGTISFATAGTGGVEASWHHVNDPLEIHERVRSAIHEAQNRRNGL
jgi:hypothetical protein